MSTGPIEDVLAIRELVERYCDAVMLKDPALWATTWAEDGASWVMYGKPMDGRDFIVSRWTEMMSAVKSISFFPMMVSVDVDRDTATSKNYFKEDIELHDGRTYSSTGYYNDVLVKVGGRWFFKTRVHTSLHRSAQISIVTDLDE
jgi:uncharacterized protein (TIGR02246 family)